MKSKLHAYWHHLLAVKTSDDPRELANELGARITPEQRASWASGTAATWTWESYLISRVVIYKEFDPGPTAAEGVPLPKQYYGSKARSIVDEQLEKGGVRLAVLLNQLFDD